VNQKDVWTGWRLITYGIYLVLCKALFFSNFFLNLSVRSNDVSLKPYHFTNYTVLIKLVDSRFHANSLVINQKVNANFSPLRRRRRLSKEKHVQHVPEPRSYHPPKYENKGRHYFISLFVYSFSVIIIQLVCFGLACAPVRCAHPSFWTTCHVQRGATRLPPPIAASLLLFRPQK
jgi:hypothetical protein